MNSPINCLQISTNELAQVSFCSGRRFERKTLIEYCSSYSGWFVYKYISSPEQTQAILTIDVIIITETWLIELKKTIIITNWTNILGWQRHKNSIYFAWLIFLWFSIRNKTFDTFDNMFLVGCRKVGMNFKCFEIVLLPRKVEDNWRLLKK